jgi:hypothetical protein
VQTVTKAPRKKTIPAYFEFDVVASRDASSFSVTFKSLIVQTIPEFTLIFHHMADGMGRIDILGMPSAM